MLGTDQGEWIMKLRNIAVADAERAATSELRFRNVPNLLTFV